MQYYGHLLRNGLEYSPKTVLLKAIRLEGIPNYSQSACCELGGGALEDAVSKAGLKGCCKLGEGLL